jgi:hypothetical protein
MDGSGAQERMSPTAKAESFEGLVWIGIELLAVLSG